MSEHTWTDAKIEELISLWNQMSPQLSTIEIGERMGISKNAAVGKAHRLDLEPRPSPIRPRVGGHESNQEPVRRRLPARTVPVLPSEAAETRYAADWVTPERLAIMKADFPTLKPRVNIIAEMEKLPGPSLPAPDTISGYIKSVLCLRRPDGFKAVSMVPRLPKTPLVTRDRRHNSVRPEPVAIEKVREVAATPKQPAVAAQRAERVKVTTFSVGIIDWKAVGLAKVKREAGRCCWPLRCDNATRYRFCVEHTMLIAKKAA